MTFAWYGHLNFKSAPLWLVVLASWGIAFNKSLTNRAFYRINTQKNIYGENLCRIKKISP